MQMSSVGCEVSVWTLVMQKLINVMYMSRQKSQLAFGDQD